MKTKFLASTAIVLIGLAGAAWAQQATPAGKPDATVLPNGQTDQALPGSEPATGAVATSPTTPATDIATDAVAERMRSYSSSTATEPFAGSVVGGLSADTMIGMSVIDSAGASVGKVSDLIIGGDDVVQQMIVEVGGFLGFGAKTTAIDLENATVDGSKSEVTIDLTRAEIDAMPAYQRDAEGWFAG